MVYSILLILTSTITLPAEYIIHLAEENPVFESFKKVLLEECETDFSVRFIVNFNYLLPGKGNVKLYDIPMFCSL